MHAPVDSTAPVAALFPPREERVRWDDYLTRELLSANERIAAGPVVPTLDMKQLRSELAEFDFVAPRKLDELLPWTSRSPGKRDGAFHLRWVGGELHRGLVCAHARQRTIRDRRCAVLQRSAAVLHIARESPRMGEDRPSGGNRSLGGSPGADRRNGPHGC
jgi:hypothetical protein